MPKCVLLHRSVNSYYVGFVSKRIYLFLQQCIVLLLGAQLKLLIEVILHICVRSTTFFFSEMDSFCRYYFSEYNTLQKNLFKHVTCSTKYYTNCMQNIKCVHIACIHEYNVFVQSFLSFLRK